MTPAQRKAEDRCAELLAEREAIEAPCNPSDYRVLRQLASDAGNHFVVSFGGGAGLAGNCALAQILDELDLRSHIKEVWGSSAGAIVGGGFCSGTPVEEILQLTEELKRGGMDVPKWHLLTKWLVPAVFHKELPDGLVRGRRFKEMMRRGQRVELFEQCSIPLRVIACTDDGHARKVIFREGRLLPAVRASMCIPGVMFPVNDWNGAPHGYFDGGVVEKVPLVSVIEEHTKEDRLETLVVLCTRFDHWSRIRRPDGFIERFVSILDHLEDILWTYQLTQAEQTDNCKVTVLNPQMDFAEILDFHLVVPLYLWARRRFKRQLADGQLATQFEKVARPDRSPCDQRT